MRWSTHARHNSQSTNSMLPAAKAERSHRGSVPIGQPSGCLQRDPTSLPPPWLVARRDSTPCMAELLNVIIPRRPSLVAAVACLQRLPHTELHGPTPVRDCARASTAYITHRGQPSIGDVWHYAAARAMVGRCSRVAWTPFTIGPGTGTQANAGARARTMSVAPMISGDVASRT